MSGWLRKRGTKKVFGRTKVLSKRSDMYAISEEDKDALVAELNAEHVAQAEAIDLPEPEKEEADEMAMLYKMNDGQLRSKAEELKVLISEDDDEEQLRYKIHTVMAEDAGTDPPPAPKPKAPAAPPAPKPKETAPEPEKTTEKAGDESAIDIETMDGDQLREYATFLGMPKMQSNWGEESVRKRIRKQLKENANSGE